MRYSHPQIVFQEVPGHISLAFAISGCTLGCKGCHSTDTWSPDTGEALSDAALTHWLRKYEGMISNVLFYGGEWEPERLVTLLSSITAKGLCTTLYTGLERHEVDPRILAHLHYLKTGRYIAERGGLSCPSTNQRFFDLKNNIEITSIFIR